MGIQNSQCLRWKSRGMKKGNFSTVNNDLVTKKNIGYLRASFFNLNPIDIWGQIVPYCLGATLCTIENLATSLCPTHYIANSTPTPTLLNSDNPTISSLSGALGKVVEIVPLSSTALKQERALKKGLCHCIYIQFSSVQSLSHVRLFATP